MRGEVGDRTNEATDIPCSFMVTELWLKHKIKSNIYIYIGKKFETRKIFSFTCLCNCGVSMCCHMEVT